MLGNFRTQVRNVVGNTAMQPARMLKASIAGLCEAMVDRVSKNGIERTTSAFHDKETFAAAREQVVPTSLQEPCQNKTHGLDSEKTISSKKRA